MTKNELKWHLRFLRLASHIADWSKDPSTKCGSVIIRPNRTIASVGYNGFPRGCDDNEEFYNNREIKYARVVHGEVSAVLNCDVRPEGCTLYTWPPGLGPSCDRCATVIIQSGIKRVVFAQIPLHLPSVGFPERWAEQCKIGLQLYEEAGIEVIPISITEFEEHF